LTSIGRAPHIRDVPKTTLTPMLTVRNGAEAVEFYKKAFGATEVSRAKTPTGQIVAEMSIEGQAFFVVDENPPAFNLSPKTLGGTTVRISLIVDEPDQATQRALDAGATVVFPIADQPYGLRQGRVQDPYGHHWLIGKPLANR
jgi:PhnB protein